MISMFPPNMVTDDPALPLQFLLATGLALAACLPIGSVSILTIHRAVSLGFRRAYLPTIGASVANTIFGVIAARGSGYLSAVITGERVWLKLLAGVILVFIGTRLLTHRPEGSDEPHVRQVFGSGQAGILMFTLVITNPLTLGFYIASFAALGLKSPSVLTGHSLALGGGILAGTVIWFIFLSAAASRFHLKLSLPMLETIRRVAGVVILLLGAVSLLTVLIKR